MARLARVAVCFLCLSSTRRCADGSAADDATAVAVAAGAPPPRLLISVLFNQGPDQIDASLSNLLAFTDAASTTLIAHVSADAPIAGGAEGVRDALRALRPDGGGGAAAVDSARLRINPTRGHTAHATGSFEDAPRARRDGGSSPSPPS